MFAVLTSCKQRNYLEEALVSSGENRPELEKVLAHYQDNPLKLRAAQFLIENMPGHYSYEEPNELTRYYHEIDSVYEMYIDSAKATLSILYEAISAKYDVKKLKQVPDIKYLTSNYLIDNIDRSFDVWQNGEWATHVGFDDFCEYLLPYKCEEGECLDNWREYARDICRKDIDSLHYCSLYENLAIRACETVNLELEQLFKGGVIYRPIIPVRKLRTAMKKSLNTCDDYAYIATLAMRAKGIPVAFDYTPQWPFRNLGHSWNILLDNFGQNVAFLGCNTKVGIPHKEDHKMAKVFRKCYEINREIEKIHHSRESIPSTFSHLCIKDVTDEYMKTFDITINIKQNKKHKYAYLAVFDNKNWKPVHWGKISGNKASFRKMGGRIVYLPVCYEASGIVPVANPFILTALGERKELILDTTQRQTIRLYRKYPLLPAVYSFYKQVIGAKIQVSNYSDFRDAITLCTAQQPGIQTCEIKLDHVLEKYRYWRYYSPERAHCMLAELYFYEKGNPEAIYGKITGTDGSYSGNGKVKELVFDKNPLTFFEAPEPSGCWVGMDFGKPVNIEKIRYLSRGDGNTITIGDEYELTYWNNKEWKSLGKKIADNIYLEYDNCPANALFLLHNLTKGVEERIFTYENEKQVWW
jgi:hypothetical protein